MTEPVFDIHTHDRSRTNAIINLNPEESVPQTGMFSAGIHPWNSAEVTDSQLQWLRRAAQMPQVLAIGETGFDTLRGAGPDRQEELFRIHVELSEMTSKPVIIHNVRSSSRLIRLRREINPGQPWIIHGFRGKPDHARQLLEAGFHLSFGERFNPASVAATPADRMFIESDDSQLPIAAIAANLGVELRDFYPIFNR